MRSSLAPISFIAAAVAFATVSARAQTIPAFPGAEGAGAYAKGGRGGDVYHVTNLNNSGAGSFADAIGTVPGAGRTIVFDVSGWIHVNKTRLTASKVTIAGQTAPGDGVGLKDGTFLVSGDDVVMRHMRLRYRKQTAGGDALDLDSGSLNSIFDHIAVEFSTDENMSSFGSPPENMTFQWSVNAWGLESHSCGGLWDQNHATSHHSLWAHNHTRNPKARPTLLDWRNNVTFDWDIGFILADSDTPANWNANVVGNYFLSGTSKTKALEKGGRDRNGNWNFHVYLNNNLLDGNVNGVLDGTDTGWGMVSGDVEHLAAAVVNTGVAVTTDSPLVAYKKVVSSAGPLRLDIAYAGPLRDEVDTVLINNVVTQRRQHITNESATGASNGGIGTLNSTAASVDTDKDGMPDFYEEALGWNKVTQDHNTALPNSGGVITGTTFLPTGTVAGYTRLEEYLHFLAIPHGVTAKNVSVAVDLRRFTSGFSASPTFTISNVSGGSVAQSGTGNAIATFTPTLDSSGRARFDFTVTDSAGSTWTQTCAMVVTSNALPRDLLWKGAGNGWDAPALNWLRPATGATVAFASGDRVAFDQTGLGQANVTVTGANVVGSVDVDAAGSYTFSGAGSLSTVGELTKRGAGTLTISNTGANGFSAATLDGGSLALTVYDAIGGAPLALNAGALNLSQSTPSPLAVNAPVAINVSGANRESTGAWTGSGTAALSIGNNTFSLRGNTSAFAGTISLGGSTGYLRLYGSLGSPLATFDLGTSTADLLNRDGNATIELGALIGGSGTTLTGASSTANLTTYNIGATGNDMTFAGAITNNMGATGIAKVGAGTLTLTGASNYTGATAVNVGALLVSGSLGNTALTVASGALLGGGGTFSGSVTASAGSFLSPGTVPFTGATMTVVNGLTLNAATMYCDMSGTPGGANDKIVITGAPLTYSGTPTFQFVLLDGTLAAGDYDLITAPSSVVPGGTPSTFSHNLPLGTRQTFTVKRTGSSTTPARLWLEVLGNPATLTWTGATSANWDTATVNNWTGATPSTFGSNDAVVFDDTSPTRVVTLVGSLAPRLVTVNTALGYTLGGAGTLDGNAALVKNGTSTLTLSGAHTLAGGVTLNAGTIVLSTDAANAGGLGNGPVTLNGGVISMRDDSASYNSFTAKLVVPTGATARINADARVDVYGSLKGGGTLDFYIPYVRTDLYADWSAFTGTINVLTDADGGDFRIATSYGPAGYANATINLTAKSSLYFDGISSSGAGTTVAIGELGGPSNSYLLGGVTGGRNFAYRIGGKTAPGVEVTFAGNISERNTGTTTSYVKTGAGTWTLGGTGAWNGGTTVEAGVLKITGSVTCNAATNVASLASLNLVGGSIACDAVNIAVGATLIGSGAAKVAGDLNNDGVATFSGGSFTVTGEVVNNGTMRIQSGAALSATGTFTNNGILDLLTSPSALPVDLINAGAVIANHERRIISATKSGSTFSCKVNGYTGHAYQFQRATALLGPWTNVGGAQAGAGGELIFTDAGGATGLSGYYRVEVTP